MKPWTFTALLTLLLCANAFATHPSSINTKSVNWNSAEKNYRTALSSENIGVRRSATRFIAEYGLNGAAESLINLLQNDKVEQIRMEAARALVQLKTDEGVNAVREAVIYDGSEKVARYCERLINTPVQELSLQ